MIAPGSRNAPLIIALSNDSDYNCISVIDERAAAFTALGMTISDNNPVAVICSSGSAVVNFYPAVVEAFYQNRPLVVITADRPMELADQQVGQTIRQPNVFANHIQKSVNLVREPQDALARNYNQRLINEAMHASQEGPVHINVPFDEPLYETHEAGPQEEVREIVFFGNHTGVNGEELEQLADIWNKCHKVMMLTGQMGPSDEFDEAVNMLNEASPFLTLADSTSNLDVNNFICSVDRLINTISEEEKDQMTPDLLITVGGELVSKMIKQYFKERPPRYHWHVGSSSVLIDTFNCLTHRLKTEKATFFTKLTEKVEQRSPAYRDKWIKVDREKAYWHEQYLRQSPFSDLNVFCRILDTIPKGSILHMANSTSVRYAQLFDHRRIGVLHYANRGTSGIDGCTSTAIGHALKTDKIVTLVTGDIAYLYDSNAFANDTLPANLRVIVINNQGGNIFRIIKGPEKDANFERFQETTHQLHLEKLAEVYGLECATVDSDEPLRDALYEFYGKSEKPRIIEVKTPRLESPEVLAKYFAYLRENNVTAR